MYIPKLNTFFIHVTKCGGTSVELFFLNDAGFKYSYSDLTNGSKRALISEFFIGNRLKPSLGYETQHISAPDAVTHGVKQFINADYTFAFVRNPWDRFVSETLWMQQKNDPAFTFEDSILNFKRHLSNDFKPHYSPMWQYLYEPIHMKPLVDKVFKLEEIDKAEESLTKRFGFKVKFGKHNTTKHTHYKDYLSPELKEKLYPLIEKDLELFNYE